jgi:hypothetical protein
LEERYGWRAGAALDGHGKRSAAFSKASDLQLLAFGAKQEDVAAFREASIKGVASAEHAAEELLQKRDPNSDEARTATVQLQAQERERATQGAQALDQSMREAGVKRVVRNGSGWALETEDGKRVPTNSLGAAQSIVEDLGQARNQQEASALVALVDNWHAGANDAQRETTLTGDKLTAGEGGVMRNGEITNEFSRKDMQELEREAAMLPEGGTFSIDGQNRVSLAEKTADGAQQLVQRLEINQSSGGVGGPGLRSAEGARRGRARLSRARAKGRQRSGQRNRAARDAH